jgi:sugar/nucleoside kinase (ribokinase family)
MLNKLFRTQTKGSPAVEFVVIGDVVMDRIIRLPGDDARLQVNNDEARLGLPLGAKVPLAQPPQNTPGGNAFNVAATLGKLGVKTQIYTVVGGNGEARTIINKLAGVGVGDKLILKDEQSETNTSTILSAGNDRIIFSYHATRNYKLPTLPRTKYVYLTSVGEDDVPLYKQLLQAKAHNDFELIFSPGSRQLNESFAEIKPIVEQSAYVIFNREEAKRLIDIREEIDDESLLRRVQQLGAKNVIMTNGKSGAVALEATGKMTRVGALQVEVVENTGAGDTFSATAIALIERGYDMQTALGAAACHAAALVQTSDHFNALLTLEELLIYYQEHKQHLVIT